MEQETQAGMFFLNYSGKVDPSNKIKYGPTLFGEYVTPVSITYNEKTKKCRVGFDIYRGE